MSDYNAGRPRGVWLEAVDIDVVRTGIAALLSASPAAHAEEFAIHDFEGFGCYLPTEFADLEVVCAMGAAVWQHGTVFARFVEHLGVPSNADGVTDLVGRFEDCYQGTFNSVKDWAEQHLEETGILTKVPESLRSYIDFESWADDAELNGDIFTVESKVSASIDVFWNR